MDESFLALFRMVVEKNAWIVELWEQVEEGGLWNPRFHSQLHDWEFEVDIFLED